MSSRMNNPSFNYTDGTAVLSVSKEQRRTASTGSRNAYVFSKKTEVNNVPTEFLCPLHDSAREVKHLLSGCHLFLSKSKDEKREILLKHGVCFKCCKDKHLAKDCTEKVICTVCKGSSHFTMFHDDKYQPRQSHGEERTSIRGDNRKINSKCTQLCGETGPFVGKSCAKTVLVNIHKDGQLNNVLRAYAIIDEQSNRTLAKSEFFDYFGDHSTETGYVLSSCAGEIQVTGRQGSGYVMESLDKEYSLKLPLITECNHIPNVKQEIPTPEVARHYSHMQDIAHLIPEYENDTPILLLVGRDLISAHHVLEQRTGHEREPYAQKLKFGWVVVGESCLGLVHKPTVITVSKTVVLPDGRPTLMDPCPNYFMAQFEKSDKLPIGMDIFQRTKFDDIPGYSQQDKEFMRVMEGEFIKDEYGNWSAPLPLKKERPTLSNNMDQARHRAENLRKSLLKNPTKREEFCAFMQNIFDKEHAEIAPELQDGEEAWYLPIFGVYHPQKPNKIRVVFDSAAKFNGHSLYDILMTGPDLINSLVGVLMKFRKERIAIMADVEQMFFNFYVHKRDRNFLRFLWFQDNDPTQPLREFRMCVHMFGNSSSPCIATLGLRKSACDHIDSSACDEVCCFVKESFYVDDGLTSVSDEGHAVQLLRDTQARLRQNGNIHLHEFSSNSVDVLKQFLKEDTSEICDMDFDDIVHRSLGLRWKVGCDTFTFSVSDEVKPFTKRGVLSTIHSVVDPLGFVAPVILGGRLLMRNVLSSKDLDWDDPLPPDLNSDWKKWSSSLKDLEQLEISRCYSNSSLEKAIRRELHVFSDASKDAIGAVAYMKIYDVQENASVGYVLGKSKVAPSHGHTIPRIELWAAVLATELGLFISEHVDVVFDATYYYTDSQVVLGYIFNDTRRFFVYVANRIDKILKLSSKQQWSFVSSECNPADSATRPMRAKDVGKSVWLNGPVDVMSDLQSSYRDQVFPLIGNDDGEITFVNETNDMKTRVRKDFALDSDRFARFSSWTRLVSAITLLKQVAHRHHNGTDNPDVLRFANDSKNLILKVVQQEFYSMEIDCLQKGLPLNRNNSLLKLSPFLDDEGLLRIGGRIQNSDIDLPGKDPIFVPAKHHVATLIVRHYHEKSEHQGRHITEGKIRSSGYWLVGGKFVEQKMCTLPQDRLTPCPPFTYIGLDTFGPWNVRARKTRGGQANAKRWAIIFCCMVSRGIHIEVVEEMSTSSFINALRRFIAIRGPVKHIRSDKGSNFVGAVKELNLNVIDVEDKAVKDFLSEESITWTFNPPYASHMGGSWERLIGTCTEDSG
ncbi:uncharacterized protein LOC132559197 [Ylistrum balloti]|uniref:uncharacterized protein LOC132559197 n=1 Tax=Ylistrum balloti TaxID=509963 RepID=UPI002905E54E|nr:uncharacterized protein LOC132559197 [Ylistrum balloti]